MQNHNHKTSSPQAALEVMMKRNKEEADALLKHAKDLLAENRKIEYEMKTILSSASSPPPSSMSMPSVPASRPDPMGGLLHATDALIRSWKRRRKKNFKQLELDLITALERVNGRP